MKRITLGAATILAISTLVVLPLWHIDAAAGNSGNGCKLQGAWIGEALYPLPGNPGFMLKFFMTYHGTGDNDGTATLEWINPRPDPGTSWSNARGVWAKSGPNTYQYNFFAFSVDDGTGTILGVSRHAGTATLTDCNTIAVTGSYELLDPVTMHQLLCIPEAPIIRRILMQGPCNPQ
jgi:hypothetical protein